MNPNETEIEEVLVFPELDNGFGLCVRWGFPALKLI